MAELKPGQENDNRFGCVLLAICVLGLFLWTASQNDDSGSNMVNGSSPDDMNAAATADVPVIPSPPQPLSSKAARHGYRQFQMVAATAVPGGSEIFSRNCYEALGKPLDWYQLDRCGAYDALAARWTDENSDVAGQDDLTYFQSETAATRYLHAATAGGLSAADADNRWEALKAMALKAHSPRRQAASEASGSAEAQDSPSLPEIVDENGMPVTLPDADGDNTSE